MDSKVIVLENQNTGKKIFRTAVVAVLYYEEELEFYLKYISQIQEEIDIFLFSSNERVLVLLAGIFSEQSHVKIIRKENRGRDLSALLVAFRSYLANYDYLCFLHDKKAKHGYLKVDIELWMDNLWGNMICSQGYITKVIELLENENYGLLLPPKPIGKYMDTLYGDPWNDNFDNVKNLATELDLNIPISQSDKDLVSIGSVFWCRVKALHKVLDHNWQYVDFVEEPMPDDATISHAIERILGFAAMDAGYKVATIMNTDYSARMIEIMQQKLQVTYDWLWNSMRIGNTNQLVAYDAERINAEKIFANSKEIYLYGAGNYGEKYLQRLLFWGYQPDGFLVSDSRKTLDNYCGYIVKELHEITDWQHTGIIITTNPELQNTIAHDLEKMGFNNYYKAVVV